MAFKYGTTKFDAPDPKVDRTGLKVYADFHEKFRRALQGVANRVLGGTAGTGYAPVTAGIMVGTLGVKTANCVSIVVNGVQGTAKTQDNMPLPSGVIPKNSACKYLVSSPLDTGAGTSGTVSGPGNIVSCADYATNTLALAACKLPDLPDANCALGYVEFTTPVLTAVTLITTSVIGTTGGTAGYYDLVCMPYDA